MKKLMKKKLENKINVVLSYGVTPLASSSVLGQAFRKEAASIVTPELKSFLAKSIHSKIGNSSKLIKLTKPNISQFIIGISVTGVIIGGAVGFNKIANKNDLSINNNATSSVSSETSIHTTQAEIKIVTLADMIGKDNADRLISFENSGVSVDILEEFIGTISALPKERANRQDGIYYQIYILEKQDKILVIGTENNNGNVSLLYRFGESDKVEISKNVKIVFWFHPEGIN